MMTEAVHDDLFAGTHADQQINMFDPVRSFVDE